MERQWDNLKQLKKPYVYMCAMCVHEIRKGVTYSGTGVSGGFELPCGSWKLNLGALKQQQMLLVIELSIQPRLLKIYGLH